MEVHLKPVWGWARTLPEILLHRSRLNPSWLGSVRPGWPAGGDRASCLCLLPKNLHSLKKTRKKTKTHLFLELFFSWTLFFLLSFSLAPLSCLCKVVTCFWRCVTSEPRKVKTLYLIATFVKIAKRVVGVVGCCLKIWHTILFEVYLYSPPPPASLDSLHSSSAVLLENQAWWRGPHGTN